MKLKDLYMRAGLALSLCGGGVVVSSYKKQEAPAPAAVVTEDSAPAVEQPHKPFLGPYNFVINAQTSDGYMTRIVTLLTTRVSSVEKSGNYPDQDMIGTLLAQEWTRFIQSRTHEQYNAMDQKFFELCVIYAVDHALNRYYAMTGVDMTIYEIAAERPITEKEFSSPPPVIRLPPGFTTMAQR